MTIKGINRDTSRWLPFARAFFVVLFLGYVSLFIVSTPAFYAENSQVCIAEPCPPALPTPNDLEALKDAGLSLGFFAAYSLGVDISIVLAYSTLAMLIFWRSSGSWVALLTAASLVGFGVNGLTEADEALARMMPALGRLQFALSVAGVVPISLLFFLFPSGRFEPRGTRWLALIGIAFYLTSIVLALSSPSYPPDTLRGPLAVLITVLVLTGALTQVYRYRRVSQPVERQQTKWMVAGMALTTVPVIAWTLFVELYPIPSGPLRIWFFLGGATVLSLFLLFLPASIAIAILRYRLWDIDILIRRSITYGALTGTLALVYFAGVILLQRLFPAQSQLATVLSTLAVAALFSPLRRGIQHLIDQRFYRRSYNAAQALANFGAALRQEVNLEVMSDSMLDVVSETMQPEHVSLWLVDTDERLP